MKSIPWQTYPKLFHLFFLQARGVKIEAWLRDKFRGWGWTRLCQCRAATKQTGNDWKWGQHQTWHLPIATQRVWIVPMFVSPTAYSSGTLRAQMNVYLSKIESPLTTRACSTTGMPAGGDRAPQQWWKVTDTNQVIQPTHWGWYQFYLTSS